MPVEMVGTRRRASCNFPANSIVASRDSMTGRGGKSGVTWSIQRFLGFGRCFVEDVAESMELKVSVEWNESNRSGKEKTNQSG